jgi:hypothetical protein
VGSRQRDERVRLRKRKPSTATIVLRRPEAMLQDLEVLANARDVPYGSLVKLFPAERLAAERDRKRRASGRPTRRCAYGGAAEARLPMSGRPRA